MSDMPDEIYAYHFNSDSGLIDCFCRDDDRITVPKYISAEKAKADKLALLHGVAEEYYKHGKSAEEWVTLRGVLNMLKQRIEAE